MKIRLINFQAIAIAIWIAPASLSIANETLGMPLGAPRNRPQLPYNEEVQDKFSIKRPLTSLWILFTMTFKLKA